MSATDAPALDLPVRRRRLRRRTLAGAAAAAVIVAVVLVVANPFAGSGPGSSSIDNGSATSIETVVRRALSSQTQESATLGYADAATIVQPAGTAPASLLQAEQTATSAEQQLANDRATLEQAQATLAADRRRAAVDCAGAGAAQTTGACTTDAQALTTDQQNVTADTAKVAADEVSESSGQAALANARSSATTYGQTSIYTRLPAVGDVIRPGHALYDVDGRPVILLAGRVTAYRAFVAGMSPGRDVAELNADLGLHGDEFTAQTGAAISSFQRAHGLPETGELLLGSVVFEPGAVRVTSVTPTRGAMVQAGAVLSVTSTRRQVSIALDAGQQSSVKVGDPVVITLPDNSTTPGRVSYVGTVATQPSSDNGSSQTPTIEVDVTPTDPAATGRLDQAPVSVSITTATVENALVVPVNALLALAGGGYAVEVVAQDGTHRLVRVELGIFDDAEGLVQVSGSGLAAGQKIVVPAA